MCLMEGSTRTRYKLGDYKKFTKGGFSVCKAVQRLSLSEERFDTPNTTSLGYCTVDNCAKISFALNPLAKYPQSTLLHELAHVYYKDCEDYFAYLNNQGWFEVRADMFSFYACRILGYRGLGLRKSLIQLWSPRARKALNIEDQVKRDVDNFLNLGA